MATPYRHGGKDAAEDFFVAGMTQAFGNLRLVAAGQYPAAIYYVRLSITYQPRIADAVRGQIPKGWLTPDMNSANVVLAVVAGDVGERAVGGEARLFGRVS